MNRYYAIFRAALSTTLAALVLSGCGSGSGAGVEANPVTAAPNVSNYNGPAPASADVQAFKLNVWDNLVPNNRCGSCHNESQSPRFVRADDINLAYDLANPLVNLNDPAQSLMVNKVRGGHNCWLSDDNACGDIIESYIENWAGDSLGGSGKTVQLIAPPIQDAGESKNFPRFLCAVCQRRLSAAESVLLRLSLGYRSRAAVAVLCQFRRGGRLRGSAKPHRPRYARKLSIRVALR